MDGTGQEDDTAAGLSSAPATPEAKVPGPTIAGRLVASDQAGPACRPRAEARRLSQRDQGRLASARPGAPSRPVRRRHGGDPRRDQADGRDQRRLRAAPGRTPARPAESEADDARRRSGGPPPPKPSRPVTARLDTSDILHERNATTSRSDGRRTHSGRPAADPDPGRRHRSSAPASDPNGPLVRSRVHRFRPPCPPSLETALSTEMPFGKFHGHTLGEIAAFEPSYIDWMASTILRDPDLLAAARVVRDDLDVRVGSCVAPVRTTAAQRHLPTERGPAHWSVADVRSPPVPSGAIVWEAEERAMMPAVFPSPQACRPIDHGCSVRGRWSLRLL